MEEKENIKDLEKVETTEEKETEEVKADEKTETETEIEPKKEEEVEVKEEEKVEEKTEQPIVEQEMEDNIAIPIDQIVTKEYLLEQLNSLNAKFDAVIKENKDLKDKLEESNSKVDQMSKKYEEHDFGNVSKNGVTTKDTKANESFDEYCSKFGI
jgi:hypothetical protein